MIHQFDHRWATYANTGRARPMRLADTEEAGGSDCRNATPEEKADPSFLVQPRYWVERREVIARVARAPKEVVQAWASRDAAATAHALALWQECPVSSSDVEQISAEDLALADAWMERLSPKWLMGWRDITLSSNERTVIASIVPLSACGDTLLLMFPNADIRSCAALVADQNSLVHDFIARQKVGGSHLKYHTKKQLANLPPSAYSKADLEYIVPRVLELTYSAWDLKGWAEDLGFTGAPFTFDPDRRAVLRAELDARYARLYGLRRDELRYILDPADVMGPDYPSETFRVLKNREMSEFGEYRTRRLVLEAWDREEQSC